MKNIMTLLQLLILPSLVISCGNPGDVESWEFDNLEQIGGHPVTVFGDPQVVETEQGKAIRFDGDGDQLVVDHNPIGEAASFTVEVVFRPDACYPENTDPRFIHIQDPEDERAKRLMIELRINEQNRCYLDAFIKTDTSDLVLIDETLTHPTEEWLHAAVVFDQGSMTTYFNGVKELSGRVGYAEQIINPAGKVAVGGRMDRRNWYRGMVKTIRVTPRVLDPGEFMTIQ
jgi:hypothetical protein